MLEHDGYLVAHGCDRTDHPHAAPDPLNKCIYKSWGAYWVDSSNSTDVSYHSVRAYYDIYSKLRKDHPGLLFEMCNDGGRMVDFGSASHGDYFSITDTYDPLSNRRAFYDTSHVLPAAMLESLCRKMADAGIENFRYMLRSGMMGWLTIMTDTNAWSAEQHAEAKQEIDLYKKELRRIDSRCQLVSCLTPARRCALGRHRVLGSRTAAGCGLCISWNRERRERALVSVEGPPAFSPLSAPIP